VLPLLQQSLRTWPVLLAAQAECPALAGAGGFPQPGSGVEWTAAGADLPLRPYLESGQLVGLASGFDGAYQYNELLGQPFAAADIPLLRRQIVGQSYGHSHCWPLCCLATLPPGWPGNPVNVDVLLPAGGQQAPGCGSALSLHC
jgi:hypothetical protein